MTVYLIMKNYQADCCDSCDESSPIGYRLVEEEAQEEVNNLNSSNELLIAKQEKAEEELSQWMKEHPNPYFYNEDGTEKETRKKLHHEKNHLKEKEWRAKYIEEYEKFGGILHGNFKLISYSVLKIDK